MLDRKIILFFGLIVISLLFISSCTLPATRQTETNEVSPLHHPSQEYSDKSQDSDKQGDYQKYNNQNINHNNNVTDKDINNKDSQNNQNNSNYDNNSNNNSIIDKYDNYKDAIIKLERTACFGTCPIYEVTLYGDGRIVYIGKDFVKTSGTRETKIPAEIIRQLIDSMLYNNYNNLNDTYTERSITDMPSAYTSLSFNGQEKRIEHYFGDRTAPIALLQIENNIDRVANTAQWTGISVKDNESVYGSVILRSLKNTKDKVILPIGAVMTVKLEGVSPNEANATPVTISKKSYRNIHELPIFYQLDFDLSTIDPQSIYAVSVGITDIKGNFIYVNDTVNNVLSYGAGNNIDIEVVAVPNSQ